MASKGVLTLYVSWHGLPNGTTDVQYYGGTTAVIRLVPSPIRAP